jgi:signal transduction histidine kinase
MDGYLCSAQTETSDLRNLIYILVLLSPCLNVAAHSGWDTVPYRLQHFDNSSGLPQNSVNAIGSDREGYLWLATENGLVRYDGEHFKLMTAGNRMIGNNRFYHIFTNGNGDLSAMNYDSAVVRIKGGNVYPDSSMSPADREQSSWYSRRNRPDSGINYHVRLPHRLQGWHVSLQSFRWNGRGGRKIRYEKEIVTVERNGMAEYHHRFSANGSWNFFLLDGDLFFLQEDGRTVFFGPQMQRSRLSGDILHSPAFQRHPEQVQIFWNRIRNGQVLLYLDKTFYTVSREGAQIVTRRIFSGFDVPESNVICALYDQPKGRLYLGSSSQGLFVLTEQRFASRHAPQSANSHYSLMPYGQHQVFTATGYVMGLTQQEVTRVPQWEKSISDHYSLAPDGENGFWSKGYAYVNYYRLNPVRLAAQWRMPGKVTMLFADREKKLWIGLNAHHGIWKLDTASPAARPAKMIDIREDATCFAEDGGRMYIGADGAFYIYHTRGGRLDTVAGMQNKYVRSAKVMAPGEVWITTYGHGFFVYRNGQLYAMPPDADKYTGYAHCIYADRLGYLWIPTNTGLFQAKRQDLLDYIADTTKIPYYHYYDKTDGLATNEFNGGCQPCAAEMGNGFVSMPSLNGVVFFRPDSIRPLLPSLPVYLDGAWLDNREVMADSLVKLPAAFNSLQLEFSSPYMGNRRNLRLAYALLREGETDTVWIPLPGDGRVIISTLPSGNYSLTVRKPNGFGLGNYAWKTIGLHVAAPWYETGWFYSLLLLLGIGGALLLGRIREVYLKRKNDMLKALVDEKTRELRAKSALQEKIIQSIGHNVLTPLKYQHFLSQKIYGSVEKEVTSVADMARVMNDHTSYLYHMVANLLKYLKSQIEDRRVAGSWFEPAKTADAALKIFMDIAREKDTVLVNRIPAELQLTGDELLLSVILHNLTDNAVKVTRGGHIALDARPADGGTVVTVADTGPGLRADILQWFNAEEIRDYPGAGGGIGLLIVRELAQVMALHVAATAEAGRGTEFTIWFPGREEMHSPYPPVQ